MAALARPRRSPARSGTPRRVPPRGQRRGRSHGSRRTSETCVQGRTSGRAARWGPRRDDAARVRERVDRLGHLSHFDRRHLAAVHAETGLLGGAHERLDELAHTDAAGERGGEMDDMTTASSSRPRRCMRQPGGRRWRGHPAPAAPAGFSSASEIEDLGQTDRGPAGPAKKGPIAAAARWYAPVRSSSRRGPSPLQLARRRQGVVVGRRVPSLVGRSSAPSSSRKAEAPAPERLAANDELRQVVGDHRGARARRDDRVLAREGARSLARRRRGAPRWPALNAGWPQQTCRSEPRRRSRRRVATARHRRPPREDQVPKALWRRAAPFSTSGRNVSSAREAAGKPRPLRTLHPTGAHV